MSQGSSRILLDTSAYSSLFRGDERMERTLQEVEVAAPTPIVLGELLAGFTGGRFESRNRELLKEFLTTTRVRVCLADRQ